MNVERANLVLKQIENDPDTWQQRVWAEQTKCGTVHCFAGWAVALFRPDATFLWEDYLGGAFWPAGKYASSVEVDGVVHSIEGLAQELLELTEEQADILFGGANSLPQLREIVAVYSEGAGP